MKWTIDSFTPSDGTKHQHVTVDHQAWIKGESADGGSIHISLNISSRGVSDTQARGILEAMVAGLNSKASTPI